MILLRKEKQISKELARIMDDAELGGKLDVHALHTSNLIEHLSVGNHREANGICDIETDSSADSVDGIDDTGDMDSEELPMISFREPSSAYVTGGTVSSADPRQQKVPRLSGSSGTGGRVGCAAGPSHGAGPSSGAGPSGPTRTSSTVSGSGSQRGRGRRRRGRRQRKAVNGQPPAVYNVVCWNYMLTRISGLTIYLLSMQTFEIRSKIVSNILGQAGQPSTTSDEESGGDE